MKRNRWKRLLAIMGAASILTVSINPVRINAGGSDLPIVSADVQANTDTAASEMPETLAQTDSAAEASSSSSDASYSVPESTQGSDTEEQSGTAMSGGDGQDSASENTSTAEVAAAQKSGEADTEDPEEAAEADTKEKSQITVKYQSADESMGTVTVAEEEGTKEEDSEKAAFQGSTAKPNAGYAFVDWTVERDGEMAEVSTAAVLVPTDVTGDTTYIANFAKEGESKTITITYAAGEGGKVSQGTESFQTGSESRSKLKGSTAEAEDGYTFLGWVKGEDTGKDRTYVSTDALLIPDAGAITEDTTYTAVFEKKEEEKTAEYDLADYVEGLKVYYRTSSDDTWTEAVITGSEPTSIPKTAELKFDFTLGKLTEAGDYTYEIPEFLADAALEEQENKEMTSTAEITTAESEAGDSDASGARSLVLHLDREDAEKELTGVQLTITATPATDKLKTAADRTRTLTFGDRTYTLKFAAALAKAMLVSTNGLNLNTSSYLTGAQVSYKSGSNWLTVTSDTQNLPKNASFRITVNFGGMLAKELLETYGGKIYYRIPDQLTNLFASSATIQDGGKNVGTVSIDENNKNTIVLTYDSEYLNQDNATVSGSFTFTATIDPEQIDNSNTLTWNFGPASVTLNFDPDYEAKSGDINITKAYDVVGDYLKYTLTVTTSDSSVPGVHVKDSFTKNANAVDHFVTEANAEKTQYAPSQTYPEGSAAGTVSIDSATAPGTLTWTIGDMGKNETRSLTYYVKLKDKYINSASGSGDALVNTAIAYTTGSESEIERKRVTSTYTPQLSATVEKSIDETGGEIKKDESGNYYIVYTVTVTAGNNTQTLRHLKISDSLTATQFVNDKNYATIATGTLRKTIVGFSDFVLTDDATNTRTDIPETNTKTDGSYYVIKGSSDTEIGFNFYIDALAPNQSKTLTYRMTFSPTLLDQIATNANGSIRLNNRAAIHTDDSASFGNRYLDADNVSTQELLGYQYWDRKIQGIPTEEPVTFSPDIVYKYENASWVLDTTTGNKEKTVPKGAYQYTVVVNEKGQWDLHSSSFADALSDSGKYLKYSGYLKVQYYKTGITENLGSANDQQAATALQNQNSDATYYLDIDGKAAFSFKPEDLGLNNKGAYVLTYYAVPTDENNYISVNVDNSFTLSGSGIGPGGTKIANIAMKVSTSVILKGQATYSTKKTGWYYDKNDKTPDESDFNNGSIYWVIEFDGTRIPANSSFYDEIVTNGYATQYFCGTSLVGVYTGTVPDGKEFTDYFNNFKDFSANTGFNQISQDDYKITLKNDSATISFPNGYQMQDGKSVYIILKTSPESTWEARTAKTFSNQLYSGSSSSKTLLNNATLSSLGGGTSGTNFKEFGSSGTYLGKSNGWVNKSSGSAGNDPANKVLTSFKYSSDDPDYTELQPGTYLDYRLVVNYAGDEEGTYTVEDQLPAGTEAVYVRCFWTPIALHGTDLEPVTDSLDLGSGWKDIGLKDAKTDAGKETDKVPHSTYAYYNEDTNRIRIDVSNLHKNSADTSGTDKRDIQLQVLLRVTDPDLLRGYNTTTGDSKIENRMIVRDSAGNVVSDSTASADLITKSIVKSEVTNGATVTFTIQVNQSADNLFADEDAYTLVDEMSNSLAVDLTSVTVTAGDQSIDSTPAIRQSADKSKTIMTFTVPDNTSLTITYRATINALKGTFSNKAYWYGYEKASSSTATGDFDFTLNAQSSLSKAPTLSIMKADQQDVKLFLPGAEFSIYKVDLDESGNILSTKTLVATVTTDGNGIAKIGTIQTGGAQKYPVTYNTVYSIEETKAPQGYVKDETSHLVAIAKYSNTGTSEKPVLRYPKDTSSGNTTQTLDDTNSWSQDVINGWASAGVDVQYTTSDPVITILNSRGTVTVNKVFKDAKGNTLTGENGANIPNGTYYFGLFHSDTGSEQSKKLNEVLKVTYKNNTQSDIQLTLYQDDGTTITKQVAALQFINLTLGDTYWIYELASDNTEVRNGGIFYNPEGQGFTVSYSGIDGSTADNLNGFTVSQSSAQFSITNTEFSIPLTGLHVSGNTPYVVGALTLAGAFAAYVLLTRRRRT